MFLKKDGGRNELMSSIRQMVNRGDVVIFKFFGIESSLFCVDDSSRLDLWLEYLNLSR